MNHQCPCCVKMVSAEHFACQFSAKGGKASGKRKARSSAQARASVMARWKKKKEKPAA